MATAVKPRLTRAFLEYHGYTIHKNIMAQHSNIKFTYINLRCVDHSLALQDNFTLLVVMEATMLDIYSLVGFVALTTSSSPCGSKPYLVKRMLGCVYHMF